jgi:hypothetical protein
MVYFASNPMVNILVAAPDFSLRAGAAKLRVNVGPL